MLQTGKSYTLKSIVPAVVAEDAEFGVGKEHEAIVITLNAQQTARKVGASHLKCGHKLSSGRWCP